MTNQHYLKARSVSYRRYLLNSMLHQYQPLMKGVVVDLGGRRKRGRSAFKPPESNAKMWVYVDIDLKSQPSVLADVMCIPLTDGVADCIICTEVLEHLANPQAAVDEAFRVLKPGGAFLGSAPFIYSIHADPHDFSRFTGERIQFMCRSFDGVEIYPMGSFWEA